MALPCVRPGAGVAGHAQALEKHVLVIVEEFVDSMLGSVETSLCNERSLDDPLNDDVSVREQLDRLPRTVSKTANHWCFSRFTRHCR